MTGASRALILDADGVFLSERPYWNAALGTALHLNGFADRAAWRWDTLADFAFGPVGLQRVTKLVGCNSNWDLAAALTSGLEDPDWRGAVRYFLTIDDGEMDAMTTLRAAATRLYHRRPEATDPLEEFGIERNGAFFENVVGTFQDVLNSQAGLDWTFETRQLKEPFDRTVRALAGMKEAGFSLRVCTGRHRNEIEAPIRELGLEPWLPFSEITSSDEVDRAQSLSGRPSLGKPHWFAPACATLGFEAALAALSDARRLSGSGVYIGDASADFRAVEGCRARGIDLAYIHARSGVTTRDQEETIGKDEATLGIVSSLDEIVDLLKEQP